MIYVTSTPSLPKGDQVGLRDTNSTSSGAYKYNHLEHLISSKFDICSEAGKSAKWVKEVKRHASWVKVIEKKKIEVLVVLSLFCALVWEIEVFLLLLPVAA